MSHICIYEIHRALKTSQTQARGREAALASASHCDGPKIDTCGYGERANALCRRLSCYRPEAPNENLHTLTHVEEEQVALALT